MRGAHLADHPSCSLTAVKNSMLPKHVKQISPRFVSFNPQQGQNHGCPPNRQHRAAYLGIRSYQVLLPVVHSTASCMHAGQARQANLMYIHPACISTVPLPSLLQTPAEVTHCSKLLTLARVWVYWEELFTDTSTHHRAAVQVTECWAGPIFICCCC